MQRRRPYMRPKCLVCWLSTIDEVMTEVDPGQNTSLQLANTHDMETPENDGGMAAAAGSIWADTSWEDSD